MLLHDELLDRLADGPDRVIAHELGVSVVQELLARRPDGGAGGPGAIATTREGSGPLTGFLRHRRTADPGCRR
jgi:hypothetical protein